MCSTAAGTPVLLRLVTEVVNAAGVAGNIVRKVLQTGNLGVVDKGINDLQTKADRAAQQYIISKLSSQFPKAAIIGEEPDDSEIETIDDLVSNENITGFPEISKYELPETLKSISEDQIVIWVDPLDGTAEFTQGLIEHVTILIGVAVGGKALAGVIHQPFFNPPRTIYGIPNVGLGGMNFKNPPQGSRIITTTRSHSSERVEKALSVLSPTEVLRVGGAGHKVMLLLEGKAHAYVYPSPGCKKWDTCAPEAVLLAAGGMLTDMTGNPYKYGADVQHINQTGVLATASGEDHSWYLKQLSELNQ